MAITLVLDGAHARETRVTLGWAALQLMCIEHVMQTMHRAVRSSVAFNNPLLRRNKKNNVTVSFVAIC